MANLTLPPKSIDEYAWGDDFISLLSKRWSLHNKTKILEVGCGYGHWTKRYERELPQKASLVLSDISPFYLAQAENELADIKKRKFFFCAAAAQNLPFEKNYFEFITCQRLLMHVSDPLEVVNELKRVLCYSGTIAILEPCSLYRSISACYRGELIKNEDYGKLCYFQATAERGKIKLGMGDNSIGENIPVILHNCGFKEIRTCLSDYIVQLLPNQKSDSQQFFKNEILNWFKARFYSIWDTEEAEKYFIAGGGNLRELSAFKSFIIKLNQKVINKINKGNAHVIINEPIFITWAKKL